MYGWWGDRLDRKKLLATLRNFGRHAYSVTEYERIGVDAARSRRVLYGREAPKTRPKNDVEEVRTARSRAGFVRLCVPRDARIAFEAARPRRRRDAYGFFERRTRPRAAHDRAPRATASTRDVDRRARRGARRAARRTTRDARDEGVAARRRRRRVPVVSVAARVVARATVAVRRARARTRTRIERGRGARGRARRGADAAR